MPEDPEEISNDTRKITEYNIHHSSVLVKTKIGKRGVKVIKYDLHILKMVKYDCYGVNNGRNIKCQSIHSK